MQFLAVDAGSHEETVETLEVRALDIGVHGVANHEDTGAVDDVIPPGQFKRPRIDRSIRLASLDDLAARRGIVLHGQNVSRETFCILLVKPGLPVSGNGSSHGVLLRVLKRRLLRAG